MEERLSWRERIQKHPYIATGSIVALLVLIVFIFSAYRFDWSGTGFLNKSLWDWLQLLIIPLALAIIALFFQRTNIRSEQEIAQDKQHQDLLQAYLDRMSELLLEKKLRQSEQDDDIRSVARARTLAALQILDGSRKGTIINFLCESKLIEKDNPIIDLDFADLTKVELFGSHLSQTYLSCANLQSAHLTGADLSGANLYYVLLQKANIAYADLSKADLSEADLTGADLEVANLGGANMKKANLESALLNETNLKRSNLREAKLGKAHLTKADLSNANLTDADLTSADLTGANLNGVTGITIEELEKQAKSLKGATMPDGSIHH